MDVYETGSALSGLSLPEIAWEASLGIYRAWKAYSSACQRENALSARGVPIAALNILRWDEVKHATLLQTTAPWGYRTGSA